MPAAARTFAISLLPKSFAICKLAANTPVPEWATKGSFSSITRTSEEVSVIAEMDLVPESLRSGKDWRVMKVHGPFELSEVGVLATLVAPLADAGVSLFTISTFETDYLLTQSRQLDTAVAALRGAGHKINETVS